MIKLKNIEIDTTVLEQVAKINEEYNEFLMAVLRKDTNNSIEEFYDVLQSMLGLLHQTGLNAEYIESQYYKHMEKLKNRPRKFKDFDKWCSSQLDCSCCPFGHLEGADEDICETAYELALKNNGKVIITI